MNELINVKQVKNWIKKYWARSLVPIAAFVVGILIGMLVVESRIIEDCKYMRNFRFGNQAFNCGRTI